MGNVLHEYYCLLLFKLLFLFEQKTQMSVQQTLCSTEGSISGFSRIETRSQRQLKALKEHTASNVASERSKSATFTFTNFFVPVVKSVMPLPELDWADPKEVWSIMLQKDRKYYRDPLYFRRHSFLQPRMRAILLDWLTEVRTFYRSDVNWWPHLMNWFKSLNSEA